MLSSVEQATETTAPSNWLSGLKVLRDERKGLGVTLMCRCAFLYGFQSKTPLTAHSACLAKRDSCIHFQSSERD